jgi:hypothetical protein
MRGRFGHRAQAGGNLTSMIASLYRQQKAAEDQVMFDAYQNGGKGLDGKPVTDQIMRSYIAGRQAGFSKDDPLYAEWGNRLTQLDFKIGEDKVTLSYQQGKVGAGAVAAYYRQQLGKIPQDSEFYRTVAGRAAQWAKAAVGAARGRAGARLSAALGDKQTAVQARWANYSQLEAYLTDAAKRAGIIAGNQTLTDADASRLQDFLNAGVAGPKGTKITYADWQHATVDAYRGFDTLIGINKQLGRGYKTLMNEKQKFLDQTLVRVNTIDDRAKYEFARDNFTQAVTDAKGDPRAILAAAQAYATTLGGIKDAASTASGTNANDPEFLGGITNEITALTTGKAAGSSVFDLQSTAGNGAPTSDIQSTADAITKAQADVKALAAGTAFFGQNTPGGAYKVNYYPPGAQLDPFGHNGLDNSYQPSVVDLNGTPTLVMLKGQPIETHGLVAPDGTAVDKVNVNGQQVPVGNLTAQQVATLLAHGYTQTKDSTTVGYVFSDPANGVTKFGVTQPDGSLTYTDNNPFGGTLAPAGSNGFVLLSGSALDPNNPNKIIVQPPNLSNVKGDTFLASNTVSAKDLLALASVEPNPQTKAELGALANARAGSIALDRFDNPAAAQRGLAGAGSVYNALQGVAGTLQHLLSNPNQPNTQTAAASPPHLPNMPPTQVVPPVIPGPKAIPVGQPGNPLIPGPQPIAPALPPEKPIPVGQPGNPIKPGSPSGTISVAPYQPDTGPGTTTGGGGGTTKGF